MFSGRKQGWFPWGSPKPPKSPHSLDQLKFLYHVMSRNQTVSEQNKTLLVETLRSIAEILIWGDQNDSSVFEWVTCWPDCVTHVTISFETSLATASFWRKTCCPSSFGSWNKSVGPTFVSNFFKLLTSSLRTLEMRHHSVSIPFGWDERLLTSMCVLWVTRIVFVLLSLLRILWLDLEVSCWILWLIVCLFYWHRLSAIE